LKPPAADLLKTPNQTGLIHFSGTFKVERQTSVVLVLQVEVLQPNI
jgi:hypothetical protein